jgi:serine protease AprX
MHRNRSALLLLVLALIASLLPAISAQAKDNPPRAHPALLQLAAEHPDDTFRVIIQREVKNKHLNDDDPETAVARASGKVRKQLRMIESFSAELTGKRIARLARHPKVRWISLDVPLVSTATGLSTIRDEFTNKSFDGNNGTVNWNGGWTEVGESAGTDPSKGLIVVASINRCASGTGNCLRLDPNPTRPANTYIYRQTDLGSAVSATLSFYRNNQLNASPGGVPGDEEVKLEISANGGASWTTLRTYSSAEFTGTATDTFDIAAYASSSTQIRFALTRQQTGYRFLYVDDVQIDYARASEFPTTVGADRLRNETGPDGQGITVAVVDSGITTNHADYQSAQGGSRIIGSVKVGNLPDTNDGNGHGTFVAGIIGGNGNSSNGKYQGVAPGVNLINVKVSNDQGMATASDLIDGLQWILNNQAAYNIRVVNISLTSAVAEPYHTSALDAAVEILWFNGIVVVVAAGNNGADTGPVTLYPPANDPFVITVGATEDKGTPALSDDTVAVFSAYGTTEDSFAKPDLVAPGRNIVGLLAGTSVHNYVNHPKHRVNNAYFRMSGTSMAAPVVSGAVALLLQDEPQLNPDQVKYRLKATASTAWPGYDAAKAGAGYLDIYAAVHGTTTQTANTGLAASQMLTTGADPIDSTVNWGSVNWGSVNWGSVNWGSVNWGSVNWGSVNWGSAVWDD